MSGVPRASRCRVALFAPRVRGCEGRGLCTTAFLGALSGKADANHDGFVTAGEIGVYVAPEVTSMSSARQTPQFGALEGEGEVVFAVR